MSLFRSEFVKFVQVSSVIDVSPGSGTLAKLCLRKGIQYTGFCMSVEHSGFLQSVVDTYALKLTTVQGSSLFNQDLATLIDECYKEILNDNGEHHADETASEDEL